MILFLNIMFVALSVLYFAGRMYEIIAITDTETGFLISQGIVTTPFMIGLICIIAVCCGVIIFSGAEESKKTLKMPVGILGIAAGAFFTVGGIVCSINCFRYGGFILYHGIEFLGGIGLVYLGIKHIKGKKRERLPALAVILIPFGVCLNSMLHEIKSIHDTEYLMRTLAGLFTLVFFMLLFKAVYAQGKYTKMALYIASLVNFMFTGVGSLAAVLGGIAGATLEIGQLLYNTGFILIGAYSLFVALYITPEKIECSAPVKKVEKEKTASRSIKIEVEESDAEENKDALSWTDSINQDAINQLFAIKDKNENQTYVPPVEAETVPAEKDKTQTVARLFNPEREAEYEPTVVIDKPKPVFRSEGKKSSTTKKIVYKAPK